MGDYRKLLVWQKARVIERQVRALVEMLPPVERRRLGDQIIRAAVSIRLNIAEGAGLNTDPQFARHLLLSLGSANEVQDALDAIDDAGYLPPSERGLIDETSQIRAMLAGLHKRVNAARSNQKGASR
ncbi:MAG: four helix bundle protein [Gemmatimonadaceae bacterium]